MLIVAAIFLAWAPAALAVPPVPCTFYGQVTVNGANAPAGTQVIAVVYAPDGVTEVTRAAAKIQIRDSQSVYTIPVNGDDDETAQRDGALPGDTVHFFVMQGGFVMEAPQRGVWQSAAFVLTNLTAEREEHRIYLPMIRRRA